MIGEKVTKRKTFSKEERIEIRKKCAGKCACCGCKLNKDNFTVDHVIPLSRGGTNDFDNLLPLCNKCNGNKADMFVWPDGFYLALGNTGRLGSVMKYTYDWLDRYLTRDYLKEYPMVASGVSFMMTNSLNVKFKPGMIVPQLIIDLFELDSDDSDEIRKITGLSDRDIFSMQLYPDEYFSLYITRRRISKEPIALLSIQADPNSNIVYITNLWKNVSSKMIAALFEVLVERFCNVWMREGLGYDAVMCRLLGTAERDYMLNYSDYIFSYKWFMLAPNEIKWSQDRNNSNVLSGLERRNERFRETTVAFQFRTKRVAEAEDYREELIEKLRNNPTK